MAKRKAKKAARSARPNRKATAARRSAKRPTTKNAAKTRARGKVKARKAAPARKVQAKARQTTRPSGLQAPQGLRTKTARLDRVRRTLEETVPGPPSSLDMDRRGSKARTGRAEMAEKLREHHGMTGVVGGDPDVDIEDAYFTGEEAPGGDNPTPDQDIVDDIGKALGVEYEDNEELKASDKVVERDKHRWELDPASSEDYKDRK
jgi:hypothetical protein